MLNRARHAAERFQLCAIEGAIVFAYRASMEKQKTELEKLDEEMRNIVEEARVIVPGIQARFGFQTIAVFNDRFADLETFARARHTLGLGMVVIAIAMLMTPPIDYRACAGHPSRRMARVASLMIRGCLVPLALGLSLDMFTVLFVVSKSVVLSICAAAATLLQLAGLWCAVPATEGKHNPGQ
ncbi:DUF6328 family protein [Massilia terrae]|uniref:DUF6328 family protein n=1 Tax=Massilia terrae TaxID=1811224 RepID=A0ABT2D563_9BURK|nr:DUF6328 family protein [Massilia terrae]